MPSYKSLTTRLFAAALLMAAAPQSAPAQDTAPTGGAEPLQMVFFDGSSLRGPAPVTPAEQALFDRLRRLADLVTLVEEPPVRAAPLFAANRYDCLLDLGLQPLPPDQDLLSSRPQMQVVYRYYQLAGARPPLPGSIRIARNRQLNPLPSELGGSTTAEQIPVNDLRQLVDLLKARRVDYALAYTGNMDTTPEARAGEIVAAPDLPPDLISTVRITCHASPQAREFIARLDTLTPDTPPATPPSQ